MGRYSVIAGQNIFDVALHLYGSIEGIVDLMMNNPDLSLDTTLTVGQELVYTDGFVINADVVAYNAARGIVPANGEHHVYPKYPEGQLSVEFHLPAAVLNVSCTASGTGSLEIDWGDNSEIEKIELAGHQKFRRLPHRVGHQQAEEIELLPLHHTVHFGAKFLLPLME